MTTSSSKAIANVQFLGVNLIKVNNRVASAPRVECLHDAIPPWFSAYCGQGSDDSRLTSIIIGVLE